MLNNFVELIDDVVFFTGYLSLEYMVTIPAYVTISLIVATAIQGIGKDAFVTMMKNMKTAIENIDTHYDINHGEGERGGRWGKSRGSVGVVVERE